VLNPSIRLPISIFHYILSKIFNIFLHSDVQLAQPLGLVDEWPLLGLAEQLPLVAQLLGDGGVVHFGVLGGDALPLAPGPDHEGAEEKINLNKNYKFNIFK
jgi:hypothetical protein